MQSIFPVNSSLLGPLNWCGHEVVCIKSALLRIYLPGCLPYPDSGTALAPTTAGSLAQRMREAGAYAWRCAQLTERKTCVTRCRSLIANCSGFRNVYMWSLVGAFCGQAHTNLEPSNCNAEQAPSPWDNERLHGPDVSEQY